MCIKYLFTTEDRATVFLKWTDFSEVFILSKRESKMRVTHIVQPVPVAQWIARWTSNPKVAGSNPAGDKLFFIFSTLNFLNEKGTKLQIVTHIIRVFLLFSFFRCKRRVWDANTEFHGLLWLILSSPHKISSSLWPITQLRESLFC